MKKNPCLPIKAKNNLLLKSLMTFSMAVFNATSSGADNLLWYISSNLRPLSTSVKGCEKEIRKGEKGYNHIEVIGFYVNLLVWSNFKEILSNS